jgi:hypothetical protein
MGDPVFFSATESVARVGHGRSRVLQRATESVARAGHGRSRQTVLQRVTEPVMADPVKRFFSA